MNSIVICFILVKNNINILYEINSVKLILKASKDKFDTRENYKDSNEGKENND